MIGDGSTGADVASYFGFSAKYKRDAYGYGLQSVRDVLLVSYFNDVIDDEEFTLLYEEN